MLLSCKSVIDGLHAIIFFLKFDCISFSLWAWWNRM